METHDHEAELRLCTLCYERKPLSEGSVKVSDIATLTRRHSRSVVEAEIAKCELVCANCHAVRTFRRREQQDPAA